MGKILARDGELSENERWINLIGDIAGCISIKRPKEVQNICLVLTKSLDRPLKYQREAAAAALSEFVRYRCIYNDSFNKFSHGGAGIFYLSMFSRILHVSFIYKLLFR